MQGLTAFEKPALPWGESDIYFSCIADQFKQSLAGENMSVAGTASHGKGKAKKKVTFSGTLSAAQWAEFKAKLKALVKKTPGLKVSITEGTTRKPRKKKKSR